jgi:DNA repair exonuclease SbcCD ATPase subunit
MAEQVLEGELVVVAQNSGLEQTKVEGLLSKFGDPFNHARQAIEMAKGIEVTSEDQKDEMEAAKVARIELKRIRVDVEHTRKELKEQSLREGKAIDGMANIIKAMIVPVEEHLEKQEKFAERLAAERKARKIAEREAELSKYVEDTSMYKFEDISDEAFKQLIAQLVAAKKAQEDAEREARRLEEEARKKAEAERLAKEKAMAAEQERIRKENEKLKAEAAAKEAELAEQRAKEEKRLAAERAEQEKKLAAERAKAEEERKKREAIEAEQRAKEEAEARAKAEAEEAQRQALLAPDKQKLLNFADVIDAIAMPNVANREAGKLLDETKDFLTRISKNLRLKAKQL